MITMRALVERAERHFPENPAIVPAVDGQGGPLTWAEFAVRVRRAAGALRALGVGAGDRFAILCRNDPRQAELIHAGYWMGAVAVPINYRLAPREIADILDNAAPRLFAVEDHLAGLASDPVLAGRAEPRLRIGREDGSGSEPVYEALRDASPEDEGRTSVEGDDALLLYTGGTTGRAKGVRLTHRNVAANGLQLVGPYGALEDDVMLHVAPMFHSADLLGSPFSHTGAAHAYLPDFTPDGFLAAVEKSRATFSMLTPTIIIRIIREGRMGDFDLSSLRRLTYGSAPMDAAWIRRTMEAFPGVELVHSYGLTETSPILTTLGWAQHLAGLEGGDRLRSVGRPLVGVELRIADDDGNDVPAGEAGEVAVRAPNVSPGYLDRPEETAAVFRDGWFYTGDVGPPRRRGLSLSLRSQEGRHHHRRGERLVDRGRGGPLRAPGRGRGGGHRGARRDLGRSAPRRRGALTRLGPRHRERRGDPHRALPGAHRRLQGAAAVPLRRRPSQERHGQDPQGGPAQPIPQRLTPSAGYPRGRMNARDRGPSVVRTQSVRIARDRRNG